ncbi:MAG TPA: endonuclease III [candidate division Zixibacteria bacterium]|nr:endonuclease III [candidate division Zixibacteria bacterium]MDD4918282.1 endonuclease III [candidate division Zixibacteria bacterium]MDM7973181.1 endonuclease III [candidate division Zixibacteria bacterium]HOD65861.1 endonuclease III [candidate division Zixibacteria bacterium]HOZ07959.1 endonuclease III [candidate division Zixibacteria bacterium]
MPREGAAARRERAAEIVRILRRHYPGACTTLAYGSVHQLLVATILSQQNTDKGVNAVTPRLFRKYPTIEAFANADVDDLRADIASINYGPTKARAIIESALQILEQFGGEVPRTIGELVRLRGVGRKTASVVLGAGYGIAEGVVVDTHVIRVSGRLGLTAHSDAARIERDLMKILPQRDWIDWTHMVILHGRAVCTARRPACPACPLAARCPAAFKFPHLERGGGR